jgi:hypothetical protein
MHSRKAIQRQHRRSAIRPAGYRSTILYDKAARQPIGCVSDIARSRRSWQQNERLLVFCQLRTTSTPRPRRAKDEPYEGHANAPIEIVNSSATDVAN